MLRKNGDRGTSSCIFARPDLWALLIVTSSASVSFGCGGKNSSPTAGGGGSSVGGQHATGGTAHEPTGGAAGSGGSGGAGGAASGGTSIAGSTNAIGGTASATGGTTSATGGRTAYPTGGTGLGPTGGAIGSGGSGAAGEAASGGTSVTGGAKATGGSAALATGGSAAAATGGHTASATGGAASGGAPASGGTAAATGGTSAGGGGTVTGPCDIYAAANPPTPCVAAYSTVRLLNSKYGGPLYQVRKVGAASDAGAAIQDIGIASSGFADSAAQDAFCGTAACTVSVIYDQSGKGNHLTRAPANCYGSTSHGAEPAYESDAKGRALTVAGHKVYALYMIPQDGYRNNKTAGMPIDAEAQGIYELVDGTRSATTCCWDFGNGSTNNCYTSAGVVNALFFGTAYWGKGAGSGPWFMADFEPVWSGGSGASSSINSDNPTITDDFAMGILKSNATNYAIRVGNARSGNLVTAYDGALPFASLKMQGGVILGIGSDRSDASLGTFFEGAITAGRPTDATDAAVLANVQAAHYGQ